MRLLTAPDDVMTGLTHRLVSENDLVEIGLYRVLYGVRVRAGFVGESTCRIDWCCGDRERQIWSHYTALALLLRRRDEDVNCFDGIPPTSFIKPCCNDPDFEKVLTDLMLQTKGFSEQVAP